MRLRLAPGLLAGAALLAAHSAGADGLHDPTRPPAPAHTSSAAHLPTPVLAGILTFDGRRSAILGGRLVHAGSIIGPLTIESVLADGVRYRDARGVHELHLAAAASPITKPVADAPRADGETHDP